MRHIFLINPRAGRGSGAARVLEMADRLTRRGLSCTCVVTECPGGAEEAARRLIREGNPLRLYACGGDGTLHEVVQAAAGAPNAAVTAIPLGTGNDFLKNFGPDARRFADAAELWDGDEHLLDLIDCNGRLCLTIACTGADARVAAAVDRFRRLPLGGRGSYLCAAAAVLSRPLSQRWTVSMDGTKETGDFTLVSVCNARHYGGGSTPVPEARPNDGILHAVTVRKVERRTFIRLFPAYSAGRHRDLPPDLIRVTTPKEVCIRADAPFVTCLDGECFRWREARLRLSNRKLRFFAPAGADPNATAR